MAQVADALHDPDRSPPDLYAYNEATVSAVYEMLKGAVQDEIVCDDDKSLRTVIWDAIDLEVREEMDTKDMDAMTESEWYSLIDGFEEEILWDGDYDMEDLIMDLPAEQANAIKEQLTISEDYFTAIPPEPTTIMLETARSTLRRLLQAASD
ncbi:MAG: hypothetical protein QM703_19310 [Gemmatales bacterium]